MLVYLFFFNDTATTEIYTLSLHDALPIYFHGQAPGRLLGRPGLSVVRGDLGLARERERDHERQPDPERDRDQDRARQRPERRQLGIARAEGHETAVHAAARRADRPRQIGRAHV